MSYGFAEFAGEVQRTFSGKEPRPCRCCKAMWTPGDWNFYDLCDQCFAEFNGQKMRHRLSRFGGGPVEPGTESCNEWMAKKKA